MTPLLVLDVHYLCHRAFHTMKELSFRGEATGVIFGFLKSLTLLKDEFGTDRVAFCFEHSHLLRRDVYPAYKRHRHQEQRTQEEQEARASLAGQIRQLRKQYLPRIGFKNVFCFDGYESDDIMAVLAHATKPHEEETILVTADSDLYQCLSPWVSIYSPQKQKMLTGDWFVCKYYIQPPQWAQVKALAGCATDEVKGIPGVGEATALRYLQGELKESSKAFQSIRSGEGLKIQKRNRRLVKLPYAECPTPVLREDCIDAREWRAVCAELGMRSLAGRAPIATRRAHGKGS